MYILTGLKPADVRVGDDVYYNQSLTKHRRVEHANVRLLEVSERGVVVAWNPEYCFVRYGADLHSKATPWNKLFKLHEVQKD